QCLGVDAVLQHGLDRAELAVLGGRAALLPGVHDGLAAGRFALRSRLAGAREHVAAEARESARGDLIDADDPGARAPRAEALDRGAVGASRAGLPVRAAFGEVAIDQIIDALVLLLQLELGRGGWRRAAWVLATAQHAEVLGRLLARGLEAE